MRSYLLTHPISRGGRLWCDRVIEGVDAGDRTALRLFGEAMRWTGAQINIANVFMERLSVRNESELVTLVESGRRMEQITADADSAWESHMANGIELIKAVLQLHPEKRASVIAELGGLVPGDEHTNGGGH